MPPYVRERTCVDCGATFTATNYNQSRCHDCQVAYNVERDLSRAYPMRDDVTRINQYIESNEDAIRCPVCYQHMTRCRCNDFAVRTFEPVSVATWKPLEMKLSLTVRRFEQNAVAMWKPWE